ncbi:hypothetical protein HKD37_18G050748 [Glycine soja]
MARLDRLKQNRNGVVGILRQRLEERAETLADQGEWTSSIDILALLVFGIVLFPNVDGLVDLAVIDVFLAYHHNKESSVIAVLADAYDTFDLRCEKSSARIVCCTPALYVWLVSHIFLHEGRPVSPLQDHRMCAKKGKVNWEELLAGMIGASKEGGAGVLCSCGGFPNVPLMGTRGCINYNPILAIRQLGYPMRRALPEEIIAPFVARGFSEGNAKMLQRIRKAWNTMERKDKELIGSSNVQVGEEIEVPEESEEVQALKVELERTRVVKEKLKTTVTRVRKECDELRDVNITMAKALEWKTKRARKEEWGRNKFRGALWGSNNELKL